MKTKNWTDIENVRFAAINVLLQNINGPFQGLPRTEAWGYPEPYTRGLMLSVPGILVSRSDKLVISFKETLEVSVKNQSKNGHIPSMVHDSENRGASDTTPLFLLATGIFRKFIGATGRNKLTKEKLYCLIDLISLARNRKLKYGFNEWCKAPSGEPMRQDWQTWSAALYLYAVKCVEENSTPFF